MASIAAPQASSYSLFLRSHGNHSHQLLTRKAITRNKKKNSNNNNGGFRVLAETQEPQSQSKRQRATPGVDTRIHWENEEEGWIGGSSNSTSQKRLEEEEEEQRKSLLGDKFADLLNDTSGSHYQFLGISVDADIEEIKAAYRRLSKEYHPDTTSLPLKAASDKFMKLRQVYDVLSNEEKRKFYDWTLAQEAASRQQEKMRMKLEDPYQQDLDNYQSVPDMVDRLGGRNMELSDQAMSALTIDILIIIFAICCIIYVAFFKESY
ncbi:hypothetical protein JCGZ_11193 [Jatropha curcas]|uniref:J domain-containing protein n=1 Tax=Jatropha curcas TaxID=180498 RepID=A0A067KF36_JATCU|nr:NAD(P)H-quinone oxidoreductase subunit T, chloroplastic [Jatropha curcas]KDP34831.1 hypothetical protein JCGZ_11193 [Jatropha curcas]